MRLRYGKALTLSCQVMPCSTVGLLASLLAWMLAFFPPSLYVAVCRPLLLPHLAYTWRFYLLACLLACMTRPMYDMAYYPILTPGYCGKGELPRGTGKRRGTAAITH